MRSAAPPEEAAAVVAAIERFLAETAPAPASRAPVNPWQRTALLEGTGAHAGWTVGDPWGEPRGWGNNRTEGVRWP